MVTSLETEPALATPPSRATTGQPLRDRVVALAEVLLCSSVPTQLALGAVLNLAGWQALGSDGQLSLSFVVTLSLGEAILLIALMVALTHARGESVAALWLGPRPVLREIGRGLLLVPVVIGMVVVLLNSITLLAPSLHNVATNPLERLAGNGASNAALFSLVAIFAGGVKEELQRAFLLQRFERHLGGTTVGVIVLSVAFGFGHSLQGRDAVITTGVLGLVWAVVYVRRRSSIAPIVSHAGFNSLEILRVAITGA